LYPLLDGIGIDIRQWFVLSKWTKKYKANQKQLLEKIDDEKLDYDSATLTKGRMAKSIVNIFELLLPIESRD